jgi:putative copper export protein
MDPLDVTVYALHSLFAGLWTGSVLFVSFGVLPLARDGELNAGPLGSVTGTLTTISRLSTVLLVLTGAYMGVVRYDTTTLLESTGGYLVIAMVALWLGLMATVEIGASRLTDGTNRNKVREPARRARRFFQIASLFAVLLLLTSGLISANNLSFL